MPLFSRSKAKLKEEIREELVEELRAVTFQDFWGTDTALPTSTFVSPERALTCVPVFAATRLISDAIAALPLQAYSELRGTTEKIDTPMLFQDPTMHGGPYEWAQRAATSLTLRGNAYGFITVFDYQGFPRQIEWLPPEVVEIDDDNSMVRPQWRINGKRVEAWTGRDSIGRFVHIPWYVLPGRIIGLSPISAFASVINAGLSAHEFGQNFFAGDGIPKAVLQAENPIDGPTATAIKTRFKEASRGRDVVVLGAGLQFQPMAVKPEEAQFLETIRATATEVASIYGIYPAELIGGDTKDSMTYANTEQQSLNLITHTLRPYLSKLEQAFSRLLPRPQSVKFDLSDLLRADQKTRYEGHKIALENQFKTRDEVRVEEGLEPLTGAQKVELDKTAASDASSGTSSNVVPLSKAANG